MDRKALAMATGVGTAAQVALVVAGHFVVFVADYLFAVGGTLISLATGLVYVRLAGADRGWALGAALSGGLCALIGIAVSVALGDVPWIILLFGSLSGVVGGLAGGALGRALFRARSSDPPQA